MSVDMPGSESGGQQPSKDERTWAMLCHLIMLSGIITCGLGTIVGPIVVWMMKKDQMPLVNDQGKEAVNFMITFTIAGVALGIVGAILGMIAMPLGLLANLVSTVVGVYALVMVIMAGIKVNNEGVAYRYPINLRLIK